MRDWKANWLAVLLISFLFLACQSGEKETSINSIQDLKTKQYAVAGQVLYKSHCANCHQEDGSGLGMLIPPLKDVDYLKEDIARSVRIIRYGLKGEIIVNGVGYNQPMPGNTVLKPIEIAQIATYIHTKWGKSEVLIPIDSVNAYLK